ncbi:hypothetical protein J6590_053357 [Homalodisca vitripennis]|nr:hypothetical protein J6590_053357 [Homalodisca vitripennis]
MESLILRDHVPFEQHLPVIPLFEWPFRPPAFLKSHLNHPCTSCQGQSCSNVESPTEEGFYMKDETTDVSLLGQFMSTQEDEEEEENREREEDGGEEEEIISDDDDE